MRLDEYRRVSQVNGREGEGFQSPELQHKAIAVALAPMTEALSFGPVISKETCRPGGEATDRSRPTPGSGVNL
jgi:hypothetical protein